MADTNLDVMAQLKAMQERMDAMTRPEGSAGPGMSGGMPNVQSPMANGAAPMPMMGQPGFGPPMQAGFQPGMPNCPAATPAVGLLVPVSIPTAMGEVTAMVQFGPEYAANGAAAQQLIQQLMQMGWPVKAWQPKPQGGFGGGRGGRGW